jgi:hypothetical protein
MSVSTRLYYIQWLVKPTLVVIQCLYELVYNLVKLLCRFQRCSTSFQTISDLFPYANTATFASRIGLAPWRCFRTCCSPKTTLSI